ncbi:transposase [Paucibacter sp. O1-1]|uniref:transposase n=1 Tax=Paucibacter sp. M5-1 TaxID=3015998 RepID=UPI0021D4C931|nr:transposase [Paucibacter sp. M5-1]MCU7373218.1 transposase [Paucibacter sp. O1-1]MCZ7879514.1 transposase [Paucibacter sp. M5-1]MDA3828217.1 transposase [Paucibacter sp. O1-1]
MRSSRSEQVPWTGSLLQMCAQGQTTGVDRRQAMPLCRRYVSAHFDEHPVQVLAADGALRELVVSRAVGILTDGDWEALGAWPGAAVGPAFWRGVWADLDSRGVDKISLVCASDLDARVLCPVGKVLTPFRRILGQGYVSAASGVGVLRAEARRVVREASGVRAARLALKRLLAGSGAGRAAVLSPDWPEVLDGFRPFYALRPHRRALVRAGDEYLEQLGLRLSRAVARHGPFVDVASAVSFVAQTLACVERRLKASALVLPAFPAHPSGPVSTFGAGGFSGSVGGCSP